MVDELREALHYCLLEIKETTSYVELALLSIVSSSSI